MNRWPGISTHDLLLRIPVSLQQPNPQPDSPTDVTGGLVLSHSHKPSNDCIPKKLKSLFKI